jgi:AcrR family transcriptional regulator
VSAAVTHAVVDFFAALDEEVGPAADVTTLLERGIVAGHRRLGDHATLQRALRDEADQIVPRLASVMPMVVELLRAELERRLAAERLRPGVHPTEAADLLARLTLSMMGAAGTWDLDDPAAVRRLVRGQLLAGVLADAPDDGDGGDGR